jgi:hypothetical protein
VERVVLAVAVVVALLAHKHLVQVALVALAVF